MLDPERQLGFDDFKPYAERILVNGLFSRYAQMEWK